MIEASNAPAVPGAKGEKPEPKLLLITNYKLRVGCVTSPPTNGEFVQ